MKRSQESSSHFQSRRVARVIRTNRRSWSTRQRGMCRSMTPLFISRQLLPNNHAMRYLKFSLAIAFCGSALAQQAPFSSSTISGLGARNIGSAAMSGRISAIAGVREASGKITLFVGSASGGVWKSDDAGTRYRPVFDEQSVQSIGAIALDPKNSKNVWVGTG